MISVIMFALCREKEFLFLPGFSCREDVGFVMGQFIDQDGSTSFVKGQVVHLFFDGLRISLCR